MQARINPKSAEILGLQALGWLAGDQDGLERFFQASGADAATLQQSAADPGMLAAILDFLLRNEDLLLRFCEDTSTPSGNVHAAHHVLEGPSACD